MYFFYSCLYSLKKQSQFFVFGDIKLSPLKYGPLNNVPNTFSSLRVVPHVSVVLYFYLLMSFTNGGIPNLPLILHHHIELKSSVPVDRLRTRCHHYRSWSSTVSPSPTDHFQPRSHVYVGEVPTVNFVFRVPSLWYRIEDDR